jgi:hypothetical protein
MAMKKYVVLAGAAALAACGSQSDTKPDGGTLTIKTDKGEIAVNTDVAFPAGYSIYPGANVTTNSKFTTPNGTNINIMMEVPDAPDKVVAFYRRQAEAAGVSIQSEIKSGTTQVISGKDKADKVFSLTVYPNDSGKVLATLTLAENRGI